ncbi:MAG: PQQ-binding-like beta-propeller repeat protein [Thermoanaerobaculia bacterium]
MRSMGRACRVVLIVVVPLLAVASGGPPAGAEEWSRFRGPNGSGVTDAGPLPVAFGPASNVAWQAQVPFGRSSPAVGERHVFLTGIEGDKLIVVALDRADGSESWRRELERGHTADLHRATDSSTPSPVTDGSNVYAFFHEAGLVSYDAAGKERWRRVLGPFRNFYGIAASPILAGDRLVMLCEQSQGSFLVAFDKDSGEQLWRRSRPNRREAYTTPILLAEGSLLVSGSRWVDAYDPATGETLWQLGGVGTSPVASPVVDGDLLFVTTVDHASQTPPTFDQLATEHDADADGELARDELDGSWMQNHFLWINNDGKGGISREDWSRHVDEVVNDAWGVQAVRLPESGGKPRIVWNYRHNIPYIPSPLVLGDVFYMVADGILSSLDRATGKLIKRGRLTDGSPKVYASPIAADGKLYIATRDGSVAVLAAGGDWEALQLNELGEEIYATPAIADDRLLVRTRASVYAFGKRPEPEAAAATGR